MSPTLGTTTIRGLFWAYGSYVGGRLLVLISIAVLARLLTPRDFGLVALALTFTALLETIKDVGLGQALVVGEDEDLDERANTAFTWGLGIGIAGAALIVAAAPLIADVYDEPLILPVLAVLALNFPLRALGATHYALAQRNMDFRTRTVAELSNVVLRGGTGIVLALMGFGVWSLVLGYLVGTLVLTVVLWLLVPWRPRLRLNTAHARELFAFGGILTAVDVLHGLWASADVLVIGRVLGATELGLYSLGLRLPELLIINFSIVAGAVLFPAFTKVDQERLGDTLVVALRFTVVVGAPLTIGLIALGDATVLALFGDQWGGAVAPMQVLAIYAFLLTLEIPGGTIFKVTGRAWILLAMAVPRTIVLYAALIAVAHNGLVAVAACLAGITAISATVALGLAARLIHVRPLRMLVVSWAPVVAALVMGAALVFVDRLVPGAWLTLLVGLPVGAIVYLAALWLLARDAVMYLKAKAFPGSA